jgi:hypothetical protein
VVNTRNAHLDMVLDEVERSEGFGLKNLPNQGLKVDMMI